MRDFLAAQAADPLDPAPMLIQADWHEERGECATAEALRGLAGAGIASFQAIALGASSDALGWHLDQFGHRSGGWDDNGLGDGHGVGYGWGLGDRVEESWSLGDGFGSGNGDECEDRAGMTAYRYGRSDRSGYRSGSGGVEAEGVPRRRPNE